MIKIADNLSAFSNFCFCAAMLFASQVAKVTPLSRQSLKIKISKYGKPYHQDFFQLLNYIYNSPKMDFETFVAD